ncbi:MAG: biopolymer transporter ExbD [Gammaproteobacteria bacterium]|nr:biopolymer transporter ExbD [Gammaproteobacteria bacterium]MDP2141361.1 biopolymer transporter ExbD [Gammaproteobacteria bacterium]MDP2349052.1 biopolymer transporter ExbD [Gammaproteobacteria bacterium]
MKFQRRITEELSINLTPLIDVVFLLLIFFMVSTTFTRETRLAVNLPEADGEPVQQTSEQIEISVSQNGSYAIDGRALVNSELSTLMSALEEVTQGNRDVALLLIADAAATHQAVVTAMDAIGKSGFSRLSIATRQPADDN